MKQDEAVERLCDVYREDQQIGLVLGAGVSKDSGVPSWKDLPFVMLEFAKKGMFEKDSWRMIDALKASLRNIERDPDTILQFISESIDSDTNLNWLVWKALYERVKEKGKPDQLYTPTLHNIPPYIYRRNKTLDTVISFCSAVPDLMIAEGSWARWKFNRKVGAILTTNYDNLVEASFGSKYGMQGLKPVARIKKRMEEGIPVYHIHGYVSIVKKKNKKKKEPYNIKASKLVLAEKDYYRVFYDLSDFSNLKTMQILGQLPCLFIGCSMEDRNIRRILSRLKSEGNRIANRREHFAILPPLEDFGEQEFEDAILNSFGVTAIRLKKPEDLGAQVAAILKHLYLSLDEVEEEHWSQAREGWCKRGMAQAQ